MFISSIIHSNLIRCHQSGVRCTRSTCMVFLIGIVNMVLALPLIAGKAGLPLAPANLSAFAVSTSQINLAWLDNSSDETGFIIQRAISPSGPWSQIATVVAGLKSYANTGLIAEQIYYFRVCAYNSRGNSSYSNYSNI